MTALLMYMIIRVTPMKHISALSIMKTMHKAFRKDEEAIV
jgi:hypothetical protein